MKTYVLDSLVAAEPARKLLSELLPGQTDPWLLVDPVGDPIAYINVGPSEDEPQKYWVSADISARHYHSDKEVLGILEKLKAVIGGSIRSDA